MPSNQNGQQRPKDGRRSWLGLPKKGVGSRVLDDNPPETATVVLDEEGGCELTDDSARSPGKRRMGRLSPSKQKKADGKTRPLMKRMASDKSFVSPIAEMRRMAVTEHTVMSSKKNLTNDNNSSKKRDGVEVISKCGLPISPTASKKVMPSSISKTDHTPKHIQRENGLTKSCHPVSSSSKERSSPRHRLPPTVTMPLRQPPSTSYHDTTHPSQEQPAIDHDDDDESLCEVNSIVEETSITPAFDYEEYSPASPSRDHGFVTTEVEVGHQNIGEVADADLIEAERAQEEEMILLAMEQSLHDMSYHSLTPTTTPKPVVGRLHMMPPSTPPFRQSPAQQGQQRQQQQNLRAPLSRGSSSDSDERTIWQRADNNAWVRIADPNQEFYESHVDEAFVSEPYGDVCSNSCFSLDPEELYEHSMDNRKHAEQQKHLQQKGHYSNSLRDAVAQCDDAINGRNETINLVHSFSSIKTDNDGKSLCSRATASTVSADSRSIASSLTSSPQAVRGHFYSRNNIPSSSRPLLREIDNEEEFCREDEFLYDGYHRSRQQQHQRGYQQQQQQQQQLSFHHRQAPNTSGMRTGNNRIINNPARTSGLDHHLQRHSNAADGNHTTYPSAARSEGWRVEHNNNNQRRSSLGSANTHAPGYVGRCGLVDDYHVRCADNDLRGVNMKGSHTNRRNYQHDDHRRNQQQHQQQHQHRQRVMLGGVDRNGYYITGSVSSTSNEHARQRAWTLNDAENNNYNDQPRQRGWTHNPSSSSSSSHRVTMNNEQPKHHGWSHNPSSSSNFKRPSSSMKAVVQQEHEDEQRRREIQLERMEREMLETALQRSLEDAGGRYNRDRHNSCGHLNYS